MSVKSVPKATVKKTNIKINKQDELDELDELTKLNNMLEEGSDFSALSKNTNNVQKNTKNTTVKETPLDDNLLNGDVVKTDIVDKRRARKLITSLPSDSATDNKKSKQQIQQIQQKTFIKNEKAQQQLIDETSDLYDNLENDLLPKNYGNKWSDEDKELLIELLKKSATKEIDYVEIALKLGRSEGGVKGEVKKMIIKRYLNGEEPDLIAIELNIQYKFVKILIKSYIDNEISNDIENLEKENKFLKLKMENMELRKNIQKLTNK